eukprot:scaffold31749_cov46-Phaeocystis_antarctica.AAC.2
MEPGPGFRLRCWPRRRRGFRPAPEVFRAPGRTLTLCRPCSGGTVRGRVAGPGAFPVPPGVKSRYGATPVGPEVHAGVLFTPPGRVTGRPWPAVGRRLNPRI